MVNYLMKKKLLFIAQPRKTNNCDYFLLEFRYSSKRYKQCKSNWTVEKMCCPCTTSYLLVLAWRCKSASCEFLHVNSFMWMFWLCRVKTAAVRWIWLGSGKKVSSRTKWNYSRRCGEITPPVSNAPENSLSVFEHLENEVPGIVLG